LAPTACAKIDETKDAADAILDRLDSEAKLLSPVGAAAVRIEEINAFLQRRLEDASLSEVAAVEASQWLDAAGLLADSKSRRGKPPCDLLRAGLIEAAEQRPGLPWGRWFVHRG
jgi:hypothetical protein